MKEHELKIWPNYYEPVRDHRKPFEVRLNDRDFQTGDKLVLREWDPNTTEYSGRRLFRTIGYIMHGPAFGIEPGHCVMAIS